MNIKKYSLPLLILFSFVIRIIFILSTMHPPLESDALGYSQSAIHLIETGIFSYGTNNPNAFITPGYPMFLSIFYYLFGVGDQTLDVIRYAQAVLSTCIVFLSFLIGKKLHGYKTGLIAALIMTFYPPAIWANNTILTEVLFSFMIMTFLYLLILAFDKHSPLYFCLTGLALGLASIVRPTPAPYIVIIIFLLLTKTKRIGLRQVFVLGVSCCIGFLLIMSPWWIRNFELYDRFVPFSTEGGNPFLIGVHPKFEGAEATFKSLPVGKDEFETNNIWYEKGKEIIVTQLKTNPFSYIRWFTVEKFARLWGFGYMNPPHYIFRAIIHLPFVILGWIYILRDLLKRKHFELSLFVMFHTFVHLVYLPLGRYAFPLMPLVIVFAARMILLLWGKAYNFKTVRNFDFIGN